MTKQLTGGARIRVKTHERLKQVEKATSAQRGQNVIAVCAISATGTYMPSMFIYRRQRIKSSLKLVAHREHSMNGLNRGG